MTVCKLFLVALGLPAIVFAQSQFPHPQAHSHNDYEHARPLVDALENGFISVEADVHLQGGRLLVSHNRPGKTAKTLGQLYLAPLDSLLRTNEGRIYRAFQGTFYLMIDCKSEAEATYRALRTELIKYPSLHCTTNNCAVRIFLSGNRAITTMIMEGYRGFGIDGRPGDLGKNYSNDLMQVVSDRFGNWSNWNGTSAPSDADLRRVKELAACVHAEGRRLRLWAIPDNELAWRSLMDAGVDFINTDHLQEFHEFLTHR